MAADRLSFDGLVGAIEQAHAALVAQASQAVNISLTLRNWMIGCYIQEYEQAGADRAVYGTQLLDKVSARLAQTGLGGVAARSLRQYRQFYLAYPQIWQTPSAESLQPLMPAAMRQTLSATCPSPASAPTRGAAPAEASASGVSARLTLDQAQSRAVPDAANHFIRDPYVFEFLGLKPQEAVSEGQLEDALLDKLQAFLLELGHGFCFEARQKRLLIGGEHFFVDLVFYHRVLKCHVLIELKNDAFQHQHLGQLNTYVSYYRQQHMSTGDQPPIGILLCTAKNQQLVEFALAGMENQLFVSRYQVQLPDKAQMAAFLQQAVREIGEGEKNV